LPERRGAREGDEKEVVLRALDERRREGVEALGRGNASDDRRISRDGDGWVNGVRCTESVAARERGELPNSAPAAVSFEVLKEAFRSSKRSNASAASKEAMLAGLVDILITPTSRKLIC